jgi:hypothetical protein
MRTAAGLPVRARRMRTAAGEGERAMGARCGSVGGEVRGGEAHPRKVPAVLFTSIPFGREHLGWANGFRVWAHPSRPRLAMREVLSKEAPAAQRRSYRGRSAERAESAVHGRENLRSDYMVDGAR